MNTYRLIALCLLSISIYGCETDMDDAQKVSLDTQAHNIEVITDVKILYSEVGELQAKLTAPELKRIKDEKPYTEFQKGLHVEFFNEVEKTGDLKANYGIRYENSDETVVRNNVVVINMEGEKLETEELTRNEATRQIYTDKQVKITTKTATLWGKGLEAREDFSTYKILEPYGNKLLKENILAKPDKK